MINNINPYYNPVSSGDYEPVIQQTDPDTCPIVAPSQERSALSASLDEKKLAIDLDEVEKLQEQIEKMRGEETEKHEGGGTCIGTNPD